MQSSYSEGIFKPFLLTNNRHLCQLFPLIVFEISKSFGFLKIIEDPTIYIVSSYHVPYCSKIYFILITICSRKNIFFTFKLVIWFSIVPLLFNLYETQTSKGTCSANHFHHFIWIFQVCWLFPILQMLQSITKSIPILTTWKKNPDMTVFIIKSRQT